MGSALVLQDLLIDVQDVETGARGFALTGDEAFLAPYDKALAHIPIGLRSLRANPQLLLSESDIKQVETLTTQKLAIMKTTVDARRLGGYEAALVVVQSRQGDQLMQSLRDKIYGITSANLRDLVPQQQNYPTTAATSTRSGGGLWALVCDSHLRGGDLVFPAVNSARAGTGEHQERVFVAGVASAAHTGNQCQTIHSLAAGWLHG